MIFLIYEINVYFYEVKDIMVNLLLFKVIGSDLLFASKCDEVVN